ncbi:MFS transporter [Thermoflavimicrobium daqui]|uniref:MFS transporter n=1 Tax=Thermoflavimicrobium daqui TaxID=2137476 RepID=A0A364KA10_9BACL|nr:MFS transporter [Thermoflavimicrobium daqui]
MAVTCFIVGTVELVIGGILNLIAADLGVSISEAGKLITVYSLAFALSGPVMLTMTFRYERKKLYLYSLFVFLIGNLLSAFSPNYSVLMLSRILLALSSSLLITLSITIVTKLAAPSIYGRAIGVISMGISGSLVLGVPLGIIISQTFGWRYIFLIISLLTIISIISIFLLLPKISSDSVLPLKKQLATLKNSKILSAHLIIILILAGHLTLYAYLAPFLQASLHLSSDWISLYFFIFGISAILGGGIGGWVTDKWGSSKTIFMIITLFIIALALLPITISSLPVFIMNLVIWSLLSWAITPAQQIYLIESAPEGSDIQIGFNNSACHIGIAIGSYIGGVVIKQSSVLFNPWIGALISLLSLGCAIYSHTRPNIQK